MTDSPERFGGVARLLGGDALERLRRAHLCVVGLGGVGSWTVEALARSGVGRFTLVDPDDVCVTNVNRQLLALEDTIGRPKAEVMAARVTQINPAAEVEVVARFFNAETAPSLLATPYTCVVDAIDNSNSKCRLIAGCRAAGVPVVTCGGAGGRRDPTQLRVGELAHSSHDRLLAQVRATLREDHGFPRDGSSFGVPCVYSVETPVFFRSDGTLCERRDRDAAIPGAALGCDTGMGTAAFVTGTFGFLLANLALRRVLAGSGGESRRSLHRARGDAGVEPPPPAP